MPEANIRPTSDREPPSSETTAPAAAPPPESEAAAPADAEVEGGMPADVGEDGEDDLREGLTPRQARRVRIVVSGVVMAAVAVALFIRLGSAPSVLTVGFYGVALILSGSALVLSRLGRTRVASGVLLLGFGSVALAEWLLASVR